MQSWEHDHAFGQDEKKTGELRTLIVVLLTAMTMVLEIGAGMIYGSMALLADGLHMASHATALAISLFAYIYARRNAHNNRFCFGTGKVNSLAGFTGAVMLALFALVMVWESLHRIVEPVPIAFNQAIVVACLGLLVNGISVFILGGGHSHGEHDHGGHDHGDDHHGHGDHHHDHENHHHGHGDHDHNLRSAYLHVLADALTSVLAIAALLAGKYFGLDWLDPVMGIVGAILVGRWSFGLLASTSAVLLDHRAPLNIENAIRERVGTSGDQITDLHIWAIAPGVYCMVMSVVSETSQQPEEYKTRLPQGMGLEHVTVEVHTRDHSVFDSEQAIR